MIDILKEADLQVEFTDQFHTASSRQNLSSETLQQRLLLGLYAIGTNAGLKRISSVLSQKRLSFGRIPSHFDKEIKDDKTMISFKWRQFEKSGVDQKQRILGNTRAQINLPASSILPKNLRLICFEA